MVGPGTAPQWRTDDPAAAREMDEAIDRAFAAGSARAKVRQLAESLPKQHLLLVGVEVPGREDALAKLMGSLVSDRHAVTRSTVPIGSRSKFENAEAAIAAAGAPLASFDWLIVTDDDIAVRPRFIDDFLGIAEAANFTIAQPAHLIHSYASHAVNQRKAESLARRTRFVESGPLTAFHRRSFDRIVPFPRSRWGWGLDFIWSDVARWEGWDIGVVDATPIEHLRPVGGGYDKAAALAEYREMMRNWGLRISGADLTGNDEIAIGWD